MSQSPSTSSSSCNFRSIFVVALKDYERKTKTDLNLHPLATQLHSCKSSSDILAVLHDKVNELDQSKSCSERLSSWLNPTVNVLYAFSTALGEEVRLILSPAQIISVGIGVLLLAAKNIDASEEVLADLFERIENFFKRLESYTEVPPTDEMTEIIVEIMVEVLNIFAVVTKEMKQGRAKKFLKKLAGRKDTEDTLIRLDRLTQEVARMAAAHILRLTHAIDGKVTGVENDMKDVDGKMDVVIKGATRTMASRPPYFDCACVGRGTGRKGDSRRQEIQPVERDPENMGYSTGSINESQYRMWHSPWGNGPVVLSRWYLRGMEVSWFSLVDLRKTRFWKEHPLFYDH